MSSVHIELAKKNAEKVQAIEEFRMMDRKREEIIDELTKNYSLNKTIDVTNLNLWTEQMNEFAAKNQLPQRKIITKEIFLEYVENINN